MLYVVKLNQRISILKSLLAVTFRDRRRRRSSFGPLVDLTSDIRVRSYQGPQVSEIYSTLKCQQRGWIVDEMRLPWQREFFRWARWPSDCPHPSCKSHSTGAYCQCGTGCDSGFAEKRWQKCRVIHFIVLPRRGTASIFQFPKTQLLGSIFAIERQLDPFKFVASGISPVQSSPYRMAFIDTDT